MTDILDTAPAPATTRGPHEELEARLTAARLGGAEKHRRKQVEAGKMLVRDRLELLFDNGWSFEDGLLARFDEGLPGDAVVTAVGKVDGRDVVRHRQRLHRQGRHLGQADLREDHPRPGTRRLDRHPDRVPVRLRRRPHRRTVRELRRPPRLGQHLLQPGPDLRPGPPGLRAVRALPRRLGLRSRRCAT